MTPVVTRSRRFPGETEEQPHPAGPVTRGFVRAIVWGRWLVVLAWIGAAAAATAFLPNLGSGEGSSPEGLVNMEAEAIQAQLRGYEAFGFPLLSENVVVQHDPDGLTPGAQARAVTRAAEVDRLGIDGLAFALPVPNTLRAAPGSTEESTTVVTYLYYQDLGLGAQYRASRAYAAAVRKDPEAGRVGVTGSIASRVEAEDEIDKALPYIEIGTVAVIALVLGIALRSFLAPVLTLVVAGVAYLVALRLVPAVGELIDVPVPRELRPLVLVLLLAIVTDYCVFFLTEMRRRLCMGEPPLEAARSTGVRIVPIVVTAGLIVAAGTGTLLLGTLGFFRALGPGMAVTAIVGTVVALTLVPALLAIAGRAVFAGAVRRAGRDGSGTAAPARSTRPRRRQRVHGLATHRLTAIAVVVVCVAGLGALAYQARDARLGFTLVEGLPGDASARRAAEDAAQGFAPGVIAPTEILVEGVGPEDADGLVRLQTLVEEQRGVAGTIGPREERALEDARGAPVASAFVAADGNTARMLVVLDADPFSAEAIDRIGDLREALPGLQAEADLTGADVRLAGQTGLAEETVQESLDNVLVLSLAALLVNLFFLILFLRALIAPLYLLFSSVLALGAAYGLTWSIIQWLGWDEITYYIPFAAAVLLLSLGSDYTIFVVGRIWQAARRRPVAEAVVEAAPRASGSISVAGLVMALSFAVLAIVPIVPLRELALMMTIGILLDAFVVRSLLAPALVTTFGRFGGWPGRELDEPEEATPEAVGPSEPIVVRHGA